MVAAHLLIAVLAGLVSVVAGALLGHLGWISLALYTAGGLSGLVMTAIVACCAALLPWNRAIQTAPDAPCAAETS